MMRRAFTLIELLVASMIALTVALLAVSLFSLVRQMMVSSTSSYLISRDVEEAIRQLRFDVRGTALASLRPYPGHYNLDAPPSLAMATARDNDGKFLLSEGGTPQWQGWVCYQLEVESGSRTGTLMRWRVEFPSETPQILPYPYNAPSGAKVDGKRVALRNVVAPNAELPQVGADGSLKADGSGGFRFQFVRLSVPTNKPRSYELSNWNPAEVSALKTNDLVFHGNTRLIQIELSIYDTNSNGKASYLSVPLRIQPAY